MSDKKTGPAIGLFQDHPIYEYFAVTYGSQWVFDRVAVFDRDGSVRMCQLSATERVIAPGLVYRSQSSMMRGR